MRRLVLLAVLVSAVGGSFAQADSHYIVNETGTILAPGPTSILVGGLTEIFNPCGAEDPDLGNLGGVDGHWIALPAAAAGQAATLVSDSVDMDVWFYDAGCGLVSDDDDPIAYNMATRGTANESGAVPASAAFAIVDLFVGANSTFTFRVVPAA